eukprot:6178219-Pleurochrysis_carterae.AAC.3
MTRDPRMTLARWRRSCRLSSRDERQTTCSAAQTRARAKTETALHARARHVGRACTVPGQSMR